MNPRVLVRWIAFSIVVALFISPTLAQEKKSDDDRLKENYELMKMFAETFEQIDQNYVKDLDRKELMEAAIQGMLRRLDRYSSYIPQQQLDRFNQSVDQEYGGIGIQVNIQGGWLTVVTPLPGGPAYFAGVRANDRIVEINGESTEGFSTEDAIARLKGPRGGEVSIGVRRSGADPDSDPETIKLVRDIIQLSTVKGDTFKDDKWNFMLDDEKKIGYVRLTHFSRHSADELETALKVLKEQGMKSFILDLRNNPGGLLRQATRISDLFVDDGVIVSTKGRSVPEQTWRAHKEGTYSDFPMAVLVNRTSASASEIVSACLQDHKRAVIVGERSWGKGSVQNVINLNQGRSALKLTTASYHRPSGKNIHRFPNSKEADTWGVSPDEGYEVKFTREEWEKWWDDRRDRDIIRDGVAGQRGPEAPEFADRQLQKAIEYVTGKSDDTSETAKEAAAG